MMRKKAGCYLRYGLMLTGIVCLALLCRSRPVTVSSQNTRREKGEARKIALTFDDGPSEYTMELSQGLKKRNVPATFFLLGENMEEREDMVHQLENDGHLLGNHSYHHVQLNTLTRDEVTKEVDKTNQLIREWTGNDPSYVRPPYGAWGKNLDEWVEMIPVFWSVDSLDWKLQNTKQVVSVVLNQVEEGDIILMHDGYRSSVDAAFILVEELQKRGFTFVSVEEMLLE